MPPFINQVGAGIHPVPSETTGDGERLSVGQIDFGQFDGVGAGLGLDDAVFDQNARGGGECIGDFFEDGFDKLGVLGGVEVLALSIRCRLGMERRQRNRSSNGSSRLSARSGARFAGFLLKAPRRAPAE